MIDGEYLSKLDSDEIILGKEIPGGYGGDLEHLSLGRVKVGDSINVLFNRRKEEYVKNGTKVLEQVGLGKRLHHRPREMSGGEQQRVAIARALINKPDILFADEPTANLDSTSSKQILELFQQLNRDIRLTILMVTHEPEDRTYVKRVIWLKDGELAEMGT